MNFGTFKVEERLIISKVLMNQEYVLVLHTIVQDSIYSENEKHARTVAACSNKPKSLIKRVY